MPFSMIEFKILADMGEKDKRKEIDPISDSNSRDSSKSNTPCKEVPDDDDLKLNRMYISFLIFIAVIGGFLFGYDTSVIAGAKLYFEDDFVDITNFDKELIVSMTLLGAALGSLLGGPVADKYGRKIAILLADFLFTVGCVVMAIAPTIPVLVLGRFIVGLGVGVAAMVVPVYLAEISPKNIRGILVNMNVAIIGIGELIALIVCLLLGNRWRWMLGLAGVPAVLQGIGLLFMSESPRWLFKNGRNQEAIKAIKKIYCEPIENLESIINEQKSEARKVREYEHYTYWESIKQIFTTFRPCLIAGCGIQMFQQLWGITTAIYYGPDIMQTAGFGDDEHKSTSLISALPLAFINALGGFVAWFFIDRLGRRWIMLRTLPFIALFMGVIGLGMGLKNHVDENNSIAQGLGKWSAAGGLFFYLMAFAIGMGPTPWTINSEIYPLHLRGMGNSLSSATNWITNFAVSISFLTLMEDVPYGDVFAFLLIVVFWFFAWIFVYKIIPETKGLSLDDVLSLFVNKIPSDLEGENIIYLRSL